MAMAASLRYYHYLYSSPLSTSNPNAATPTTTLQWRPQCCAAPAPSDDLAVRTRDKRRDSKGRPGNRGRHSGGGRNELDAISPPVARRWSPSSPSSLSSRSGGPGRVALALALLRSVPEPGSAGFVPDVGPAFHSWGEPLSAREIVSILNQEPSWRRALAFFRWVRLQTQFETNAFTFNVMLKSLRRGLQWETATEIWREMEESNIEPDAVSYSTMINFAARKGLLDEAQSLYKQMQLAGVKTDAILDNTMIDVYARLGNADAALCLFESLRSDGNPPLSNITYSTMAKLYGNRGDYLAVLAIYREMQGAGVIPNDVTFNAIIQALGRSGKTQIAMEIFKDMSECKVRPTPITWTLLIRMHGKARMIKEAFEIVDLMNNSGGAKPDTVVYNSLLNSCAESGLVEEGEDVFRKMQEGAAECKPDVWSFRAMVDLYASAGLMESAKKAFEDLLNMGYSANTAVYTSLIQGFGKANDIKSVQFYFDRLISEGLEIDDRLCGAFLSVLASVADEQDTAKIIGCIGVAKPSLKEVIDALLSDAFSEVELEQKMGTLLSDSQRDSHMPICNALIDLCWKRGLGSQSHSILHHGYSSGVYASTLSSKTDLDWLLDLRSLSFGAAQTSFHVWLGQLAASAEKGELPPALVINACLGKRRLPNEVSMGTFIGSLIGKLRVPFKENDMEGQFVATSEDFQAWLPLPPDLQSIQVNIP